MCRVGEERGLKFDRRLSCFHKQPKNLRCMGTAYSSEEPEFTCLEAEGGSLLGEEPV